MHLKCSHLAPASDGPERVRAHRSAPPRILTGRQPRRHLARSQKRKRSGARFRHDVHGDPSSAHVVVSFPVRANRHPHTVARASGTLAAPPATAWARLGDPGHASTRVTSLRAPSRRSCPWLSNLMRVRRLSTGACFRSPSGGPLGPARPPSSGSWSVPVCPRLVISSPAVRLPSFWPI